MSTVFQQPGKEKREEFANNNNNNKNKPHGINVILTFIVHHGPHFYKTVFVYHVSPYDISYCLHTLKLYSQLHINDYISLFYLYFQIYIMFLSDDSSNFNLYYFSDMKFLVDNFPKIFSMIGRNKFFCILLYMCV